MFFHSYWSFPSSICRTEALHHLQLASTSLESLRWIEFGFVRSKKISHTNGEREREKKRDEWTQTNDKVITSIDILDFACTREYYKALSALFHNGCCDFLFSSDGNHPIRRRSTHWCWSRIEIQFGRFNENFPLVFDYISCRWNEAAWVITFFFLIRIEEEENNLNWERELLKVCRGQLINEDEQVNTFFFFFSMTYEKCIIKTSVSILID